MKLYASIGMRQGEISVLSIRIFHANGPSGMKLVERTQKRGASRRQVEDSTNIYDHRKYASSMTTVVQGAGGSRAVLPMGLSTVAEIC